MKYYFLSNVDAEVHQTDFILPPHNRLIDGQGWYLEEENAEDVTDSEGNNILCKNNTMGLRPCAY